LCINRRACWLRPFPRAKFGGKHILHQDFPYWTQQNPAAARVGTAMIMLDEANRENGCLGVTPGAHEEGVQALRVTDGFGNREMDTDLFDHDRLVAVEAPAGLPHAAELATGRKVEVANWLASHPKAQR